MARVTFVSVGEQFTSGLETVELEAGNVFQLVRALERRFEGLGDYVEKYASVAVDGAVVQDWTTRLSDGSEVTLFPKISGGDT